MLSVRARARIIRDERGVAAVEFALLAPILLALLLASLEFPRALGVSQNVTRAARTIADLASRGSQDSLDDTYLAANAVAQPYDFTPASVTVSTVGVYLTGSTYASKVCSSTQRNGSARAVGSTPGPTPASFAKDKARYVLVEVSLSYKPMTAAFPFLSNISFSRTVALPVRHGVSTNGDPEVVMPGRAPCPKT